MAPWHPPRRRVPLRHRRARRGDAPPRPRRGTHPHRAHVPRLGRRRRVQRRPRAASLLRAARAIVTALADNDVGRLVEDLILQGGVDTAPRPLGPVRRHRPRRTQRPQLHRARLRRPGRGRRLRPRPHRAARSCAPATSTGSTSSATEGARWFHTGGIFAACRTRRRAWSREAMSRRRRRHRRVVRPQLPAEPLEGAWRARRARAVNRELARYVDVMIGNEEDFTACLGFAVEGVDEHLTGLDPSAFEAMIEEARRRFPNLRSSRRRCGGAFRDASTTGVPSPGRPRAASSRRPRGTTSRSSTASAAATASSPGSSTGCSTDMRVGRAVE